MRTLKQDVKDVVRTIPWWCISAVVHALMLLVLSCWKLPAKPVEEKYGAIEVDFKPPEPPPIPIDVNTRITPEPPAVEPSLERPDLPEIEDQLALSEREKMERTQVIAVEDAFGSRNPRGRAAAVASGGATRVSEDAVELGLAWLARNQLSTGSWHANTGLSNWADPGVTGLATLAFLGAGYTHRSGKYQRIVHRAISYLKDQQDTEGCIAATEEGKRIGGFMYGHAICALAFAEAFAMTKDILLREPAERAIDFICLTQNATGGWRYYADSPDGDSSVSGWMVMALRSASLAGLVVPPKAFDNARRFFDSVTNKEKGFTVYMAGMPPSSMALIAVGLLCHQYLGMKTDDPFVARAGELINRFPPKWIEVKERMEADNLPQIHPEANNYYAWYYANLALHQARDEAWEKWHPQTRDLLTRIQEKKGRDEGSWPPDTKWALRGGRPYATAMAILALEVYYRYAPMYRETVDQVLAAYGDALAAYNHFARLHEQKKPEADAARKEALDNLAKFLALSEPKPEQQTPRPTLQRRGQAGMMVIRLHLAADEHEQAVPLLTAFPDRFPGTADGPQLARLLADSYRARAKQLDAEGKPDQAKAARTAALKVLQAIAAIAPGKDPELELWMAGEFFGREEWEKALDLYRRRVDKIDLKKLDPKSEEGETVAAIYSRILECCGNLRYYKMAAFYIAKLERLVGASLATQRQRAILHRKQKQYAAARRLYDAILPRLPQYGKEWWETTYDLLFMSYLEGREDYVAKVIGRLQISHPDLGGETLKTQFLDLLRRIQKG